MNTRFKTKNLSEKLLQGTQQYIEELKKFPEVVGILITGGLARGFADKFSDIDIEFFLHENDFDKWERKSPIELNRKLYDNDVEIEFFNFDDFTDDKNESEIWTMANRWDKSHSKVVYDPKGLLRKLLSSKVVFHPNELKNSAKRAREYAFWFGNMVAESWVERGDITSAHTSLNFAVESLIDYLFLVNNQFIPHRKWKFFYVKQLKVLPQNFSKRLDNLLLVESNTAQCVNKRIGLFEKFFEDIERMPKKNIT